MNNQNLEIQLGFNSLEFKEDKISELKKRNIIFNSGSCMFLPSLQRLTEVGVANAYLIPFKTLEKNGFKQIMLEDIENMSQFERNFIIQKANTTHDTYRSKEDLIFKDKVIKKHRLNHVKRSNISKHLSYKESSNILAAWCKELEDGVKIYIFARDSDDYTRNILEWPDPCIKKVFNDNEIRMRQDNVRYLINKDDAKMSLEEYFCQLHDISFSTKCSKSFWDKLTWSSYFVFPNESYVKLEDMQETLYDSARLWTNYEYDYFKGFDGFEIVMKDTKEIYSDFKLHGLTLSSDGFWGRLLRFISNDITMKRRWSLPVNTCDLLKFAPLKILVALFNIVGIISWKRPHLHKDYRGVFEVPSNLRFLTPLYWVYQIKIALAKLFLRYLSIYDNLIRFYEKLMGKININMDLPYFNRYDNTDIAHLIIKSYKVKDTEGQWLDKREYFANERLEPMNYLIALLSIISLFVIFSPIPSYVGLSILTFSLFLDLSVSFIYVGFISALSFLMQLCISLFVSVMLTAYSIWYILKKFATLCMIILSPIGYIFTKLVSLLKFKKFNIFKKSQGICLDTVDCEVPQRKELLWRIFMDIKEKTCTLVEWK